MLQYLFFDTSLGSCAVVWSEAGIVRVVLPQATLAQIGSGPAQQPQLCSTPPGHIQQFVRKVRAAFEGAAVAFDETIDSRGLSPFQRAVYEQLRQVPAGSVTTYGGIATALGQPRSARAVGRALASNPTPLIVPCHRVIRSNGDLGGFSASSGTDLKRKLLQLEGWQPTADSSAPRR